MKCGCCSWKSSLVTIKTHFLNPKSLFKWRRLRGSSGDVTSPACRKHFSLAETSSRLQVCGHLWSTYMNAWQFQCPSWHSWSPALAPNLRSNSRIMSCLHEFKVHMHIRETSFLFHSCEGGFTFPLVCSNLSQQPTIVAVASPGLFQGRL